MSEKVDQAIEIWKQARTAEREGRLKLAEAGFLQSHRLFVEACKTSGTDCLNAAGALNALTFLGWSREDYEGALRSAQESVTMIEAYGIQFIGVDAGFIYDTACDLVTQMQYELSLISTKRS